VEGDTWGKIWAIATWKNVYGMVDENTPRGVFLRITKMEPQFERKVGGVIS
jgi:hypothetical protein